MKCAALGAALFCIGCVTLRNVQPGDTCQPNDAICSGKDAVLFCESGRYRLASCFGPSGCEVDKGRGVACDQSSGSKAEEFCFPPYEGKAQCGSAPDAYLICQGGKWTEGKCERGNCQLAEGNVICQ